MQTQQVIKYNGTQIPFDTRSEGIDTYFIIHLPDEDIQLRIQEIDDEPTWVEDGKPTERAHELGRLIEEYDSR